MLYRVDLLALDDPRYDAAARMYTSRAGGARWQARLFRPPTHLYQSSSCRRVVALVPSSATLRVFCLLRPQADANC
jgi:hypothetical protein